MDLRTNKNRKIVIPENAVVKMTCWAAKSTSPPSCCAIGKAGHGGGGGVQRDQRGEVHIADANGNRAGKKHKREHHKPGDDGAGEEP